MTNEEIEWEIARLQKLKIGKKYIGKTADNVQIEIGKTYYKISDNYTNIKEITPQNDWDFDGITMTSGNGMQMYHYQSVWSTPEKAKNHIIKCTKEQLKYHQKCIKNNENKLELLKKL